MRFFEVTYTDCDQPPFTLPTLQELFELPAKLRPAPSALILLF